MTNTAQATKNAITLKGSAAIISEYLNYGINSILFQRGIYPPETFENTQQYGLTILMSKDEKIVTFLKNVLSQVQEWISQNKLEKINMTISDVHTKETLECWEFKVQSEPLEEGQSDTANPTSSKDLKRVQEEIRNVMRQISATVSYLPLIDGICTFDILIHTLKDVELPKEWDETDPAYIKNSQSVQLRSFSTGLHKVETFVNYKVST